MDSHFEKYIFSVHFWFGLLQLGADTDLDIENCQYLYFLCL